MSRGQATLLILAVLAGIIAVGVYAFRVTGGGHDGMSDSMETEMTLVVTDDVVGDGAVAAAGQQVEVHYTGWLYEDGGRGRKFDSSLDRGQPFVFPLGAGRVIQGWDQGVAGMMVGGKRTLLVPSHLAYGEGGRAPVIPPNATLLFEVELLAIR